MSINKSLIFGIIFLCGFIVAQETKGDDFSLNYDATTEDFKKLLAESKDIINLALLNCQDIDFEDQSLDLSKLKSLKSLNLGDTKVTAGGLQKILSSCSKLEDLGLWSCQQVNFENKDLTWGAQTELKVLDLSETTITADGLQKILSSCSKLKELNLHNCTNITATGFEKLDWQNLKKLNFLYLENTNISVEGLKKIFIACPKLVILDLRGCSNLEEQYRKECLSKKKMQEIMHPTASLFPDLAHALSAIAA